MGSDAQPSGVGNPKSVESSPRTSSYEPMESVKSMILHEFLPYWLASLPDC